jgi:TRAP-type transport system small permease protein
MKKIHLTIDKLLDRLIILLLSITIISVISQVIFRYLLHDPLVGSEELAKLSFVWMIFLGAAVVTRDKLHIQVDYFFGKFPIRVTFMIDRLMKFLTLLLFVVVAGYGFKFVGVQKGMLSVGLNIPLAFYSFAVPTGSLFILYYTIRDIISYNPNK